MAKRHYSLDTQILSIFFLVAMPFVAVGAYIVVGMASSSLRDTVGSNLEQRAVQTRVLVERYVGEQFVMLRLVARYPEVGQALARAEASKVDAKLSWGEAPPELVQGIVNSPLASRLRDVVAVRPGVRLLQVVDARGRLVASSSRGGRLANAETPWFAALAQEPIIERPILDDFYRSPGSSITLLGVAWPMIGPEGQLQGVVRALLDGSEIYGVLAPVRLGKTGHAELVRATDGLVLASDQSDRVLTAQVPGFAALERNLPAQGGYWNLPEELTADGKSVATPARIVGVSPVEQVPGLRWLVTVEQDLEEALAPVSQIRGYLWMHFIGAFGTVILLGLYYSIKMERPVLEDEVPIVDELEGRSHLEELPESDAGKAVA